MAIASLINEDRLALKEHGHPEMWEVAWYGDDKRSITLECIRCGMVLLELVKEGDYDDTGSDGAGG